MKLSQIAPELQPIARFMPPLPLGNPLSRRLIRSMTGLAARNKSYPGVRLEQRHTTNGTALRIFTPESGATGAALLWIHGGGMLIGSANQDDAFCAATANKLGVVIISTNYRLAPENPFPAAIDDCFAAWQWIQSNSENLHISPAKVAVGGQSAGGGLAAALVQRIHDFGGLQPPAQWLFCPMLDDRTAAQRDLDPIKHFVWNNQNNRVGWQAYLGQEPGAVMVPQYAVPARRENLQGLSATWIGIGDVELFYQEAETYATQLRAAGVDCTLTVVHGAPHAFETFAASTPLAKKYIAESYQWLQEKLANN